MYLIIIWQKIFSLPHFQLRPSQVLEKNDHQSPTNKDNICVVSDVNKQSDEESGAEEDMVPVEIKPGHIRFQPRGKGF
jgi:coilin